MTMYVQVTVEIGVIPIAVHHKEMRSAARSLTNDKNSVHVAALKDGEMEITAVFTINKARQMDVVDKIGRRFWDVGDYQTSSISFPKKRHAGISHAQARRLRQNKGSIWPSSTTTLLCHLNNIC